MRPVIKGYISCPNILIFHAGGNDIGTYTLGAISLEIDRLFGFFTHTFPKTTIVFSEILYRKKYRHNNNFSSMESVRKQSNKKASTYAKNHGGFIIKHRNINQNTNSFPDDDPVHLNDIGNEVFIQNIYEGLCNIIAHDK